MMVNGPGVVRLAGFEDAPLRLGIPEGVRDLAGLVHGLFSCFLLYSSQNKNGKTSLAITLALASHAVRYARTRRATAPSPSGLDAQHVEGRFRRRQDGSKWAGAPSQIPLL